MPDSIPTQPSPAALAPPLVAWFREHARELPWRHEVRDPYRVWVSEVMLQQTQVATVTRYYEPFLERFPDVSTLAAADEDEVLAAWQGLGFYRRARNLHKAAQQVVSKHGGQVPREPDELQALPGLGRYTVGAILSLVDDRRLPILDGNVARVLARVFQVSGPPQKGATQRRLWALAEATLPPKAGCGAYNEALMELGALVCRPLNPACARCPLRDLCAAHAAGDTHAYPEPKPQAPVPLIERTALLLKRGEAILFAQRPETGLLARMWELPSRELEPGQDPHELASLLARELGARGRPSYLGASEHRFSHRHWTTHVFRADTRAAKAGRGESLTWAEPAGAGKLAIPTAAKKTLRLAGIDL
ncbi:MAG: A/G-specific adenine glycosylase [Planctomycetes bacterium]|nr:A/G-specific adenine glycosylase [Planctomycetota bacterium]